MISNLTELYHHLRPDLPGIETPMLEHMVREAVRDFCEESEVWREELSFNIVDSYQAGLTAYNAAIALGMSTDAATERQKLAEDAALEYELRSHYDADIIRPWKVWDSGNTDDEPIDPSRYFFTPGTQKLRFKTKLRAYSPTATAWATATPYVAGDFVISATDNRRYLCAIAHTSNAFATDLAAYRWQVMHNDLIVRGVLAPRVGTCEIAGWFIEKWHDAIIARTKSMLLMMKDKKWSAPERVTYWDTEYTRLLNRALRERFTEDRSQSMMIQAPMWVK